MSQQVLFWCAHTTSKSKTDAWEEFVLGGMTFLVAADLAFGTQRYVAPTNQPVAVLRVSFLWQWFVSSDLQWREQVRKQRQRR